MPCVSIPLRRATTAWPSSCRTTDAEEKERAERGEREGVFAHDVLVEAGQRPDHQEEDDEPARVHANPDPEDPRELDGRSSEHGDILPTGGAQPRWAASLG